jgi:hypothetical protein
MRLYHGSPKKLEIIKPKLARGLGDFENQRAVFLCKSFRQAALYAVGKTLKGKTMFAVTPRKLVIVGDNKPRIGYVYGVDVKNAVKGERGQYSYNGNIKPIRSFIVKPRDYNKSIIYVKDKGELLGRLNLEK